MTIGEGVTAPDKTGYTFEKWEIRGGVTSGDVSDNQFTMPDHNVEFYAVYTVNSHDVIYKVGSDEHDRQSHSYGTQVTRGDGVSHPTKAGSVFTCWTLQSPADLSIDGSGKFTMPDSDVIFEATFRGKYTVRNKAYDENGDEISLDEEIYDGKEYYNGDEVTVAPTLTDPDLIFDGWNVEAPDGLVLIQAT